MTTTEEPATPEAPPQAEPTLVAVTGGGGFIGSHLVEELLGAGHRVRALVHYNALGRRGHLEEVAGGLDEATRARLEILPGDITDVRCVRTLVDGAAVVYHLSALIGIPYSYIAPESYLFTNVRGTLNVLEACRAAGNPRLVHTSTSEVYGTARTTPMDEFHPLQAQSPYAASKLAADQFVESYHLSFGMPVVIVRPFNTYGPRQSLRAVVPTIIAQALDEKCPSIRLGALDPVRDLTFVTDTARAFRMLGETPLENVAGRIYNLGVGRGISIGSLAGLILRLLEVDKPIEQTEERQRPERSEVRLLISNNNRVRREVKWAPEVPLEEGLRRTAEWLRPRLREIRAAEYAR